MSQIVAQAEAEREQEVKAMRRAELFARARTIFGWLCLATILIFAYNFHDKLNDVMSLVLPNKKPSLLAGTDAAGMMNGTNGAAASGAKEPVGQAAVALKGAAQAAASRDNLIESLASGAK